MSYYFDMNVICSNAFFAVQDKRSYLSEAELNAFCGILQREIGVAIDADPGLTCCRVVFDLAEDESSLPFMQFVRTDGYVMNYGEQIDEQTLRIANYCLGFGSILDVFERARSQFRTWLLRETVTPVNREPAIA